jgi:hypothetical protein
MGRCIGTIVVTFEESEELVGNAVPEEVQFIQAKKVRPSTGLKFCQVCSKEHTIL